ncbi:3-methyl-2-oxobutanoate hydroxymethyltransferase [Helicobacter apodemus]|uniref:3-methyl-2-oxobutanoate hydroxymethyltransferase n=1 Tax=Helicobacter apodemus TaxID=135569 RepID=A0A4U8UCD2_9HELI|nr:3-methyl-2-oxobutanoate hydroxymethyltransferase [Helicobacter apodemus]TLE14202.1 3-methyl-2-oxobutanoate hydroxymethyltransferase [Helicobacter apodemus]
MSIQSSIKSITITQIKKKKNQEKITMITAYDALFAKIFDGEVDMILVGDSLRMSFFGACDTLSADFESMIYHTQAVCNGAKQSLVVCDLPFGALANPQETLAWCIEIYKKTNAQAVKIEGGIEASDIVRFLVKNGISVMAHIGLKPHFVRFEGGYKIQGKDTKSAKELLETAKVMEECGVFSILIEGVKAEVARQITQNVGIPVIGIGSGRDVDGQVLVWSDTFGFFEDFKPKFVRQYLKGAELVRNALKEYVRDIKSGDFPNDDESY